jgi:integrase/recombinase XerD
VAVSSLGELLVKLRHGVVVLSTISFMFQQQKRFTMQLTFWLRKVGKVYVVYAAISVNGGRRNGAFSTGLKVQPSDWCNLQQRIVDKNGKVLQGHVDNMVLDKIYAEVKMIYLQLSALGKPLSAQKLKEYYLKGFDFVEKDFWTYAKEFVEQQQKLAGKSITKTTAKFAKQWLYRVGVWVEARKLGALLLSEFKAKHLHDFITYQLTEATFVNHGKLRVGYEIEVVRKDAYKLKSLLQRAFEDELIEKNIIRDIPIRLPKKPKDIVFLESWELDKIQYHKFASERLQRIADLFVFQCYTGFAYVDAMSFDAVKDTVVGADGKIWIAKERSKTGQQSLLPFFTVARKLYAKGLHRISNGNYNDYLKEVAAVVGIKKNLTTHVARKTAAMLFLEHGCDLDTIARMCGHTNAAMTKKFYTRIRIERIAAQLPNEGRLEW